MKILAVEPLALPDVKVVRFQRFADDRGYFTETFRADDLLTRDDLPALRGATFRQMNESFSRAGVVRGLHFQGQPAMGKLVRTVRGRMVDLALDIRVDSRTFGKIVARDMPRRESDGEGEWIWVPPGFAHGVVFLEDTTIEYLCTEAWNPPGEGCISPLAPDLDWSLAEPRAATAAREVLSGAPRLTDKDRDGLTLGQWREDPRSGWFS